MPRYEAAWHIFQKINKEKRRLKTPGCVKILNATACVITPSDAYEKEHSP